MRGLLIRLHRWVGLALTAVLIPVAVSGGLLLLRGPWDRWQYPTLARPITGADVDLFPTVLDTVHATYGAGIRSIKLPQPGRHAFQVWLADGSEALVDARTGTTIDRWHPGDRVAPLLFDLHAHLMAGGRGEVVNGVVAALSTVFLGVGGLLVWWPRRAAMPLRAVWPRTWSPGALLRSHAAVGALTAAPILLFLVTGLGLAWSAWLTPSLSRALDRTPAPQAPVVADWTGPPAASARVLAAIDAAFAAEHATPGGPGPQLVFLIPGRTPSSPLVARVRLPGEWHPNGRSLVYVHPGTAAVLGTVDARRQGLGTRLGYALYPLHAARVGANTSWLLVGAALLASLALVVLGMTGVWTWVRRR